jgi:cytochrome c oxidase subunit 4
MERHVSTTWTYLLVFAGLLALTGLTLALSGVELGAWHTAVGLTIATTKALLVILFFMHVLYSSRLTWVVALSSLFWLGILLVYTLTDYMSRDWLDTPGR